ncbi:DNA polymerase III subunit theta [Serratia grimesii]|nr:DNA polymerase III subunit theta [Serratia grimesii]CAI0896757.1 DNA polymerase III subunit theta [Serratia grimesii]
MSYNLGNLLKEEMDQVNVDLVASGVAYIRANEATSI